MLAVPQIYQKHSSRLHKMVHKPEKGKNKKRCIVRKNVNVKLYHFTELYKLNCRGKVFLLDTLPFFDKENLDNESIHSFSPAEIA